MLAGWPKQLFASALAAWGRSPACAPLCSACHTRHACVLLSTRPLQVKVEKNTTIEISGCVALGGSLGGVLEVFGWRQERLMLMPAGWRHTMLCTLCRTLLPPALTHPHPTDSPPIPFTHLHPPQVRQGAGGPVCSQRVQQARARAVQGQGCAVSGPSPLPACLAGWMACVAAGTYYYIIDLLRA